jgi:uncharacterized metal-binding protein YceD (DUF177 family)
MGPSVTQGARPARDLWPDHIAWSGGERSLALTADADLRTRLAEGLDLETLERLDLRLKVHEWRDGLELRGEIQAQVTRTCVVTLEPFASEVTAELHLRVVPIGSPNAVILESPEVEVDPDAEDPPDVAGAEGVNLSEAVREALSLALDPYPRRPGAVFEAPADTGGVSPFDKLKGLLSSTSGEGTT